MPSTYVSIVDLEQISVCWGVLEFLVIPCNEVFVTHKHGGFIGYKA